MTYIIENAEILRGRQIYRESIMTNGKTIEAIRPDLDRYNFRRMNAAGFLMTPGFTVLNGTLLDNRQSQQQLEDYLRSGVTSVITYVSLYYGREMPGKMDAAKRVLEDSPMDFAIAVKLPLASLSPDVVREAKRRKVPAIFVEINSSTSLAEVPWGWIREAMFPGNCPLIPIFNGTEKDIKVMPGRWKKIMTSERIPSVHHELKEGIPLAPYEMNKMGLYPLRSSLLHRSELTYNLYRDDFEEEKVDEVSMFLYHRDRLAVTVRRGEIIQPGIEEGFAKVKGEHIKVTTHSFYALG